MVGLKIENLEARVRVEAAKELKLTKFTALINAILRKASQINIQDMEKSLILKSLEKNKGNITRAAKDLGIDRLALYRRLEKYGL